MTNFNIGKISHLCDKIDTNINELTRISAELNKLKPIASLQESEKRADLRPLFDDLSTGQILYRWQKKEGVI